MEIMLLKDVYKLGRAGEVKRVANGYGRNYLIPQGLATLATKGALKQSDRIRDAAELERARLNKELTAVHDQLNGLQLDFPVKAGEAGKLYGSVTNQMISEAIMESKGIEVDTTHIDAEPIRALGVHPIAVRLTVDLIPALSVVVYREELTPESAFEREEPDVEEIESVGAFSDLQADLEAQEAEERAALELADERDLEQEMELVEDQGLVSDLDDEEEGLDSISPEEDVDES